MRFRTFGLTLTDMCTTDQTLDDAADDGPAIECVGASSDEADFATRVARLLAHGFPH